jgi:hypothetical protein
MQVQAVPAVAAAGWYPAALRTEQLNDQDTGPIMEEGETGQRPECKDITDRRTHAQNLLGPKEIPRCEERHTRAPLEIRRRPI